MAGKEAHSAKLDRVVDSLDRYGPQTPADARGPREESDRPGRSGDLHLMRDERAGDTSSDHGEIQRLRQRRSVHPAILSRVGGDPVTAPSARLRSVRRLVIDAAD